MITGFARTTAEVSATMNMSPMGAQHVVAQAEALDARLPAVAALLAAGRTDWRTVQVIIARTELVSDSLIGALDAFGAPFSQHRHPNSGSARLRASASIPRWMLSCTSQYFSSRYSSSSARSGS